MKHSHLRRIEISTTRDSLPRFLTACCLALVFLLMFTIRADSSFRYMPPPEVEISATSGKTIPFRADNGEHSDGEFAPAEQIPHLVLLRNGSLTGPGERELTITLRDLRVPSAGAALSLEVSTMHTSPEGDGETPGNIPVWQETRWVSPSGQGSSEGQQVSFHRLFEDLMQIEGGWQTTPTDYFQVDIRLADRSHPHEEPLYEYHQDYAFLLENQYQVDLPAVSETSPGAAPSQLMVYYCDMYPFLIKENEPLPREGITSYLGRELIPAMQDAFRQESEEWGFTWHDEWRGYRSGEPQEQLTVALTDGSTWFHGRAYPRGSGGITLRVDSPENSDYPDLTSSLVATFYHELFHNLQRSLNLHLGSDGEIAGKGAAWAFFAEGTAVLATSVGQAGVQFSDNPGWPDYFKQANGFLAGGGHVGRDLKRSYQEIDPYHAVIYWRFLYEKCGGMSQGPAAGMQIIRNSLHTLYSREVVDIQASTSLVEYLPAILDRAIQSTPSCPFIDYRDSLLKFSRALFELQLKNGRCVEIGSPSGCGLYDPAGRYLVLPIQDFTYAGGQWELDSSQGPFPPGISTSFGMDFIKINLTLESGVNSLSIALIAEDEGQADFVLQVVKIDNHKHANLLLPDSTQSSSGGTQVSSNPFWRTNITLSDIELDDFNQLGMIITRTDNQEHQGAPGNYSLVIEAY